MKIVKTPHDRFFRGAMSDLRVAKDFLHAHLPEKVQSRLDLEALELQPTSYVDQSLKAVTSDVLYKARLKGQEGEAAYIYLLLEHQSTDHPLMAFRVWQYLINIWADLVQRSNEYIKKLPLIVPVVFYSGKAACKSSTDLRDLIQAPKALVDKALFERTFQLIDIGTMTDEELQKSQWAGTMALAMKHIRDRDIVLSLKRMMGALRQIEQAGGTEYIMLLLHY